MSWYQCTISGEHFPGVLLNKPGQVGFRATLFVEANTVDGAELKAFQILRVDARLKLPYGVSYPLETKVHLDGIEPALDDVAREKEPEIIFFDENP